MESLREKIVIVTGAAGSIGSAIARALAARGATVVIHYGTSEARAEALRRSIVEAGGQAVCQQADLGRAEEARGLVTQAAARFGRVDVLVNNAGHWDPTPLDRVTEAQVDHMLRVDFVGPFFACQAALPHFPAEGGRIVHLSSGLARRPVPGSALLGASKAAIEALTRSQAKEWGARGITVNAVAPGVTENAHVDALPDAARRAILAQTALGRIGRPEDVAGVVAFLASDEARWITGQVVDANGGMI
jgi:3-oxoacyl-[acyl-carrier protein] reductase